MNILDANHFPLHGQNLIEASAGTGKTYTIASLYSRLLMGHRHKLGHNTPLAALKSDQILVVTFTNAATEELKGRIRERLHSNLHAAQRFESGDTGSDDVFTWLDDIAADVPSLPPKWMSEWLSVNATNMDDASIFTIHGFCQRALTQHALNSGVLFDTELVQDSASYLEKAAKTVWRRSTYPLSGRRLSAFMGYYKTAKALEKDLRASLQQLDCEIIPRTGGRFFPVDDAWQALHDVFLLGQTLWRKLGVSGVVDIIAESGVNKRSYSKSSLPKWAAQVDAYFSQDDPLNPPDTLIRFAKTRLDEKAPDGNGPEHALFDAIDTLQDRLIQLFRFEVIEALKQEYWRELERAHALSTDDLIRLLKNALDGPRGEALAAALRSQYPAAMIDEFQDTDRAQYDIFNKIYPPSHDEPNYCLTLIGDPKQAIYAFRGADIFTYIYAKHQLDATRRFTLSTNWRSTPELIAATNTLWQSHPQAFVFGDEIPFYPVRASQAHLDKTVCIENKALPAMSCFVCEGGDDLHRAREAVANQCALQIKALLSKGEVGGAPVIARDIAVLVRSGAQAQLIRHALKIHEVGSVFLSRDSVLLSPQARDLWYWLNAVTHLDERAIRSALFTQTHGLSGEALGALLDDETQWEKQFSRFGVYRDVAKRKGVMPALLLWLSDDERAVNIKRQFDGERALTNVLHLGELLQKQSRAKSGLPALLNWLTERVFADQRDGDEAQLRLESEDNLVNIVTIHRSKGLSYPVVMLPFVWDEGISSNADARYFDESCHQRVWNLAPDADAKERIEQELLAENMRLLYVATTRAELMTCLWLNDYCRPLKDPKNQKMRFSTSSLGYLLRPTHPAVDKLNLEILTSLNTPDLQFCAFSPWPSNELTAKASLPTLSAFEPTRYVRSRWRVSSYSQLLHSPASKHQSAPREVDEHDDAVKRDETWGEPSLEDVHLMTDQPAPIHLGASTYPKGPNAGVSLHSVFEHWDFNDATALPDLVRKHMAVNGLAAFADDELIDVCDWFLTVAKTPITTDQNTFYLSQIEPSLRIDELEFLLPIGLLSPSRLAPLLSGAHTLTFDPVSGYLKGFMDLVCCVDGRYFVIDYKSNQLDGYDTDHLNEAMAHHHYDLQAGIYLLALDRLLRARLKDYAPHKHLGGAIYAFVRGMNGQDDQAGIWYQSASEANLDRWRRLFLRDEHQDQCDSVDMIQGELW